MLVPVSRVVATDTIHIISKNVFHLIKTKMIKKGRTGDDTVWTININKTFTRLWNEENSSWGINLPTAMGNELEEDMIPTKMFESTQINEK